MNPEQPQSPQQFPQQPTPEQPPYTPPQVTPATPAMEQPQPLAQAADPQQQAPAFPQTDQANAPYFAAPQATAPLQPDEDAKISSPKYWLTILGVIVAYALLSFVPVVKNLLSLVWIVVVVLSVRAALQLGKTNGDVLPKNDKFKMIILMALDPLISQAIYYYSLKKQKPATAKKALSIGWKTFIFQLLLGFIIGGALVAIVAYNNINHKAQDKNTVAQYGELVQKAGGELKTLGNDVNARNSSAVEADCQAIQGDATKLQALPPVSDKTTADKVSQSNAVLYQATSDCLTAVKQNDSSLFAQSVTEFTNWGNSLDDIKADLKKI